MRRALAPMLFEDDDKPAAARRRRSAVAKALRSEKAERKAHTKLAADGSPVHSFQTRLEDLATLARKTLQPKDGSARAVRDDHNPDATAEQRALDLLGVSHRL